jgi:branched-chain amino acid transport system permease protein
MAVVTGVMLLLPLYLNRHWMSFLIGTWILVYFAYAWNLVGGYIGQLSMAHPAFWGIGAYSYVLLVSKQQLPIAVGLAVGIIVAGLYALFIAFASYRFDVRGYYFALLTLAFTEIPAKLSNNVQALGAAAGLHMPTLGLSMQAYYYIGLAIVLMIMSITFFVANSRIGVLWLSVRDDEQAAEAVGINLVAQKTLALTFSAGLTAIGGAFHAEYLHLARPDISFDFHPLIFVLAATFLGGRGTVWGPLLGVIFLRAMEMSSSVLPIEPGRLNSLSVILENLLAIVLVLWFTRGRRTGSMLEFIVSLFTRPIKERIPAT